ncbi:hypothetical protein Xind_03961 [Xenorhabdus indica]|nr:hypothetical protein [Xenorhabdus indica]
MKNSKGVNFQRKNGKKRKTTTIIPNPMLRCRKSHETIARPEKGIQLVALSDRPPSPPLLRMPLIRPLSQRPRRKKGCGIKPLTGFRKPPMTSTNGWMRVNTICKPPGTVRAKRLSGQAKHSGIPFLKWGNWLARAP